MKEFLRRIIIVFIVHLIFKSFDFSFHVFSEITWRGTFFSFGFIVLWVIIWYLGEVLYRKTIQFTTLSRGFFHLCYGFLVSVISNSIYRFWDVEVYGNLSNWAHNSFLNPEFSLSLTLVYFIGYVVQENIDSIEKKNRKKIEKEKQEKLLMSTQLKGLKAQLEPHFLFNALGVLDSLIDENPKLASNFVNKLSKTLRFFISQNQKVLIPLSQEIEIVENYFFLQKTRFREAILLEGVETLKAINSDYFLPPASIQILVENAIKHNKYSTDDPLVIQVFFRNDCIIVKNTLRRRLKSLETTSIGLKNIQERYHLIAEAKQVIIKENTKEFIVKIPLFNKKEYENFNY